MQRYTGVVIAKLSHVRPLCVKIGLRLGLKLGLGFRLHNFTDKVSFQQMAFADTDVRRQCVVGLYNRKRLSRCLVARCPWWAVPARMAQRGTQTCQCSGRFSISQATCCATCSQIDNVMNITLLSVDVFVNVTDVCLSVCLFVGKFAAKYLGN